MNRGPAGITLIELVVAITITGMVVAAGYGALASVMQQRDRVEAASAETMRAVAVRHAISSWLGDARLTIEETGATFRGLDGETDGLPDDDLLWLTAAPTPLGAGEAVVRLYVDRDERSPERGLTARFAEWRGTRTATLELDARVTGLEVRYRSPLGGSGAWLPSWISSTVLPWGAEVTLSAGPADTVPPVLLLPIVVPIAGGR